jgi:cytochrome b pre-mRNA-processing protein 3
MILERLRRPGPVKAAAQRLYAAVVAQARAPALYGRLGAPDTPDGRFELYTLHVLLLLERLKGQGAAAAAVSQALFDHYISGLDHGLRELAVGDLSVGKTMRKLGEAFYGRAKNLEAALGALPGSTELEGFLARTAFNGAPQAEAGPLAAYVIAARADLAAQSLEALLEGVPAWRAPG